MYVTATVGEIECQCRLADQIGHTTLFFPYWCIFKHSTDRYERKKGGLWGRPSSIEEPTLISGWLYVQPPGRGSERVV